MITLQCTKCKATLTMDAAFAGGVCRCQHCGTIQTVPSHLRDSAASSGAAVRGRSAYERNVAANPGSGLDELGEIIASSGLSSSRLRQAHGSQSPVQSGSGGGLPDAGPALPAVPAVVKRNMPLLVGAAVAVVLVGGLMAWLTIDGTGGTVGSHPSNVVEDPSAPSQFAGLSLTGNSIIYLIDRGDGSREVFGEMKEATFASIASLGESRRFQIIFWDNGNERAYPATGTMPATTEAVTGARQALDDVYAFGLAEIRPALRKAMAAEPDEVVIVTAKGYLLDDEFVKTVNSAIGSNRVMVHTVMVGSEDLAGPLPAVASAHGGQFRAVSASRLREFARSSGL